MPWKCDSDSNILERKKEMEFVSQFSGHWPINACRHTGRQASKQISPVNFLCKCEVGTWASPQRRFIKMLGRSLGHLLFVMNDLVPGG